MNRENIKRVRDVIAALPPKRFSMAFWATHPTDDHRDVKDSAELLHDCGTAACIGGWTMAVLAPEQKLFNATSAEDLLGLSGDASNDLFCPPKYYREGLYTQPHAVRVLDHLLETGVVDWKSTRRAKKALPVKPPAPQVVS